MSPFTYNLKIHYIPYFVIQCCLFIQGLVPAVAGCRKVSATWAFLFGCVVSALKKLISSVKLWRLHSAQANNMSKMGAIYRINTEMETRIFSLQNNQLVNILNILSFNQILEGDQFIELSESGLFGRKFQNLLKENKWLRLYVNLHWNMNYILKSIYM